MTDSVFSDDEEALLALMPEDGSPSGNISLRRILGWPQGRYEEVRDGLVGKGALGVGKGQGGSVWLVQPHILQLVLSVPPDGSMVTRGTVLKRTGWSEERFVLVANIAIERGVVARGPRNNLALILTPEVEEFLLVYTLGDDITGTFNAAAVAATLSWDVNRVYEIRARILEREHLVAEATERQGAKQTGKRRPDRARLGAENKAAAERADTASAPEPRPLEVFVAYAPADSEVREKLYLHVSTLRRKGVIRDWSAAEILPGEEWEKTKREKLNRADLVLLLISSDFIGSYGDEMTVALERHKSGQAVVVPVIVRRCHWESTELGKLTALPKGGAPIRGWSDIDEALYSVVQGIEAIVKARSGY